MIIEAVSALRKKSLHSQGAKWRERRSQAKTSSQCSTPRSSPATIRWGGRVTSALTGASSSRQATSVPAATSHSRTVLSLEPDANHPFGTRQRAVTPCVCPSRDAVLDPFVMSHSRIVLSSEPEANRPSAVTQIEEPPTRDPLHSRSQCKS